MYAPHLQMESTNQSVKDSIIGMNSILLKDSSEVRFRHVLSKCLKLKFVFPSTTFKPIYSKRQDGIMNQAAVIPQMAFCVF